jgi:hypothetical protein
MATLRRIGDRFEFAHDTLLSATNVTRLAIVEIDV